MHTTPVPKASSRRHHHHHCTLHIPNKINKIILMAIPSGARRAQGCRHREKALTQARLGEMKVKRGQRIGTMPALLPRLQTRPLHRIVHTHLHP